MGTDSVTTPGSTRRRLLPLLGRLVVNAAVPVLIYLLIRPRVHSDLTALVIGSAVPIAYTVVVFLVRRRLDPVGVIAVICFCLGLVLAIATGGSELVFKVRSDLWTGPLGLVFLTSVAVHRPLLLVAMHVAARRNGGIAARVRRPQACRITNVATSVIGIILLVHAAAMIALAVATSTTTFLVVSRPLSWSIIGAGLIPLVLWIHRESASAKE